MSPMPRRKKKPARRRGVHPLVIAGLMIFAAGFVTFYAFNEGLPFVHNYTVYAVVNNSVNVRTKSPVRIAGIDVGEVQSTAAAGNNTKIIFTLDDTALPIHTDATVRVRDRLFLEGGYYLELNPGTPSAPLIHDGFTIPLQNTQTPVQFYKVLSSFDAPVRVSLENVLNNLNEGFSAEPGQPLSDSGAGGLKRAIPQLTPVLKDVAWVTRALHGTQDGDVERLLTSAAAVTGTLNDQSAQLTGLISGLNRTSTALASTDGALGQTIAGLDQTLRVSPAALSAIDHSLPPLANLAKVLTPSLRVSPPIISSVTNSVNQLTAIITPAKREPLITSLRTTLTDFPKVVTQLASAFPVTQQVSDCLRTNIVPVFKQQVADGSLSTGRPVWQDFVHFLPSVAGATGSFDANGHYTRVLAGAGNNSLTGGLLGTINTALGTLTNLVGISPGGAPPTGARPAWIGQMKPSAFRPDVRCSTQALPNLAGPAAAADLTATRVSSPQPVTHQQLQRQIARASGAGSGVSRP